VITVPWHYESLRLPLAPGIAGVPPPQSGGLMAGAAELDSITYLFRVRFFREFPWRNRNQKMNSLTHPAVIHFGGDYQRLARLPAKMERRMARNGHQISTALQEDSSAWQ
jgi:hypothetical protein